MYQSWQDLLFLHWTWDAEELAATLPPGLTLDTFQGRAYLGVVPFKMRRIRPRFLPSVPWISNFLELNLRTYVHDREGVPGVWFYSLDANRQLAVTTARALFSLPYHHATMSVRGGVDGAPIDFDWTRRAAPASGGSFRYRGVGPLRQAAPESLEYFLLERYVLFACRRQRIVSGRVHHRPYPFQDAEASAWSTGVFGLNGFAAPTRLPDHVAASPGVDVSIYALEH